ncbi:MAG: HEAT repeat domain-containing protein [Acidimicrobiia bacterium]
MPASPLATRPGSELDAARARVVARGLVLEAITPLTPVVIALGLSLEALGPVKQLQKRFFSDVPWTRDDDEALADAIGPGVDGTARHELAPGLTLWWGWEGSRFRLRVTSDEPVALPAGGAATGSDVDLGLMFDGVVVPEATPSPRTIRFATPPLHTGPSREYDTATAAADPRVARLFQAFDAVTGILVGPDFVAVTLSRPDRWEPLLGRMLRVVTEEFTGDDESEPPAPQPPATRSLRSGPESEDKETRNRSPRRLDRAWAELAPLRADRAEDLDRILAAARDNEPTRRQVAAVLLAEAPPAVASHAWTRLLGDPSRMVRRSVVDTVVDARREMLRPLLEQALDDSDAWVRWKALRGIAALGAEASREAVEAHAADPDFRVRLEASRALSNDPVE